jgi:hypothetical protein
MIPTTVDDGGLCQRLDALRGSTISRGEKFSLIAIGYVKWLLEQPWMTRRDQLAALEFLSSEEGLFSRETIAAIPALDAAEAQLFFEIGKLDSPQDRAGRQSFDMVASNEFFLGIVGKNPAFVAAVETMAR